MSNATGKSRMTKLSTPMRICRSRNPMAETHGVRANKTTTEMALRVNTTPTNAFPII